MIERWVQIGDIIVNMGCVSTFWHAGDMTCYRLVGNYGKSDWESVHDPNCIEYKKLREAAGIYTKEERDRVKEALIEASRIRARVLK